jgi:hypothetical protein
MINDVIDDISNPNLISYSCKEKRPQNTLK